MYVTLSDISQFVDIDPTIYSSIRNNGMPLHYRPCPIPNHSALMKLPLTQSMSSNNQNQTRSRSENSDPIYDLVISEVANALVIDIHTHLLPPTHGSLCLWGIDELLTYVRVL
jgi:hypothetical protein